MKEAIDSYFDETTSRPFGYAPPMTNSDVTAVKVAPRRTGPRPHARRGVAMPKGLASGPWTVLVEELNPPRRANLMGRTHPRQSAWERGCRFEPTAAPSATTTLVALPQSPRFGPTPRPADLPWHKKQPRAPER